MARCAYTNVDFARIFILTTDGAIFSSPKEKDGKDKKDDKKDDKKKDDKKDDKKPTKKGKGSKKDKYKLDPNATTGPTARCGKCPDAKHSY